MATCSNCDIDFTTHHYKQSRNFKDLSYCCSTPEGIHINFQATTQGLHVLDCAKYFTVKNNCSGRVFSKHVPDNGMSYGDNIHTGVGTTNTKDNAICTGVVNANDSAIADNTNCTGVDNAIDTVTKSMAKFNKRYQLKGTVVQQFQHVAAHPSNSTIIYSTVTNSIKNNPITKQDVLKAVEILGHSKYSLHGKT